VESTQSVARGDRFFLLGEVSQVLRDADLNRRPTQRSNFQRTELEGIMTAGPLHPANLTAGRDRQIGLGHGIDALGPSDTSDSGSDLHGAPGLAQQIGNFGLEKNPVDLEESTAGYTAGPDVGDANLDSDSDSNGTGERAAAVRDTIVPDGADIAPDHLEVIDFPDESDEED
jgi:hypothetical protein